MLAIKSTPLKKPCSSAIVSSRLPSSSSRITCGASVRSAIWTARALSTPPMRSSGGSGPSGGKSSPRSSTTATKRCRSASVRAMVRSRVVLPLPGSPTTSSPVKCCSSSLSSAGSRRMVQLRAIRRLSEVTFCRVMPCPSRCTNCPATPTRFPAAVVRYPSESSLSWVCTEPLQRVWKISSICSASSRIAANTGGQPGNAEAEHCRPCTVNVTAQPVRRRSSCTCAAVCAGSCASGAASQAGRALTAR